MKHVVGGDYDYYDAYDDNFDQTLTPNDEVTCSLNQTPDQKQSLHQSLILVLKYCHRPCGQFSDPTNPICIKTCYCPKNSVINADGSCSPMNATFIERINKNHEVSLANHSKNEEDLGKAIRIDSR